MIQIVSWYLGWAFRGFNFRLALQKACQWARSLHCAIMGLRCPQARPLHNKILHSSHPPSIEMKHENKELLPAFWKAVLRHSIKQHIIKTHFERKITSSILPQIVRAIFQRPSIMEIMKRQFHPWVELGRPSAMLALCFIMLGCKHWDTGLQVVDTSVHGNVSPSTKKSTVQRTE